MNPITVLITGAGAPGAPGIIKSLRLVQERQIRIVGVDMKEQVSGSAMVDASYEVPAASEESFIPRVVEIAQRENVNVIIPLNTAELLKWAQAKGDAEKLNIHVLISPAGGLEVANSKYLLMQHCKENGIPTPEFVLLDSYERFERVVRELGYPGVNVCFKPPVSNGLRGFRILTKSLSRLDLLLNEKPNNTITTLEEVAPILKEADPFPELLVMEYLPGEEYSVDVLCDNGKVISVIPRSRDELKMGISFVGTTVKDDEIISYSSKIVETLELHGNIGLQFKRDATGIPKILESNPRVQGTIVLCTAAGANLVYLAVKLALGEKVEVPQVEWGTKMVRFWDEVYFDNKGNSFRL